MRKNGRKHSSALFAAPVDTSDRFNKMAIFYHAEAERCAKHRAYFAACVLAAAALEAMLLSMCYVTDRSVRLTAVYKKKKFKTKRNRFLEFNLYQLIEIAAELKWVPEKEIRIERRKTTLKKLLHSVRGYQESNSPGSLGKRSRPQQVL